mmetsp:Transcript_9548/g.23049  ORF Transcript_9548/g.23049 Transcript_9548/m.23049 type:complete len:92 (-) Transcript_9548:46-321(-)
MCARVAVTTMFFWSCFALASGPLLFPSIFTDLLNPVMVTSLPILLYPMFDTDVTKVEGAPHHSRRAACSLLVLQTLETRRCHMVSRGQCSH